MYFSVLKNRTLKIILHAAFLFVVAYSAYYLSDSAGIALCAFVGVYFSTKLVLRRNVKRGDVFVSNFFDAQLAFYPDRPGCDAKAEGWLFGTAYPRSVANKTIPLLVWVRVEKNGFVIHFANFIRRNPIVIGWDKIKRIEWKESADPSTGDPLARLDLTFKPFYFFVPWKESYCRKIPDQIGLEKVRRWSAMEKSDNLSRF